METNGAPPVVFRVSVLAEINLISTRRLEPFAQAASHAAFRLRTRTDELSHNALQPSR